VEDHPEAVEDHPEAVEDHPGAMLPWSPCRLTLKPWRLTKEPDRIILKGWWPYATLFAYIFLFCTIDTFIRRSFINIR
jgi:hypothetical protein